MTQRVLLDTGPFVAFLDGRDRHHVWARAVLHKVKPPLFTCEAVITEACHLLRHLPGGRRAVVEVVRRGRLSIPFRLAEEAAAVEALIDRYSDVPMALADACLVRMAELDATARLLTLDGDFHVYRRDGGGVIPLLESIPS